MRIAVIDGQGGGIGKLIVEKLREQLGQQVEILALGTNVLATSAMLKAGADEGATGENAIVHNAPRVDFIVGSMGIISANTMLGELTPAMARAVSDSPARKVLVPLNRCNFYVVGVKNQPLPQYIDELVDIVKNCMI
jgi:NAD(P)-dependent dehydrogenase (short-subunit alcohol dehydrogenase family)